MPIKQTLHKGRAPVHLFTDTIQHEAMAHQTDLVDAAHTLHQVICVKG